MGTVQNVQLQLDRRDPVPEFGVLGGEAVLVDGLVEPQVEQTVLLGHEQRVLTVKLVALGLGVGLGILSLGREDRAEPVADFYVFDPHGVEDRENVAINIRFGDANARVPLGSVAAAPVVDVVLHAGLGFLGDAFAGDDAAAVAAGHELARVGQFVRVVDVPAEQGLHAVPGISLNDCLVLAGVPLAVVLDLADEAAVAEQFVDRAAMELWGRFTEDDVFVAEPLHHAVERERFVGEELEDFPHDRGLALIDDDRAPAVLPHVAVAVGRFADEPALLNAASMTLAHIYGLLLGVEAGHVGEGPPHHAAGGVRFSRL